MRRAASHCETRENTCNLAIECLINSFKSWFRALQLKNKLEKFYVTCHQGDDDDNNDDFISEFNVYFLSSASFTADKRCLCEGTFRKTGVCVCWS